MSKQHEPITLVNGIIGVRPKKAAEMTGLSRAMIYNLMQEGTLRRCKVGTATLIPVIDLIVFMDNCVEVCGVCAEPSSEPMCANCKESLHIAAEAIRDN